MNHLRNFKIFENLYNQIEWREDDFDFYYDNLVSFSLSEKEIDSIKKVMGNVDISEFIFNGSKSIKILGGISGSKNKDGFEIQIYKENDDYFMVRFGPAYPDPFDDDDLYFKCDQFHGLLALLQHLMDKYIS